MAMLLVLFALFFRPVGFDYRSKIGDARWRRAWDWGLFAGGAVPSLIFGVAFGNLLQGVPFHLDSLLRAHYEGSLLVLDEPGEGLDPATERAMMDRLLEAAGGRTVLLITHRATGLEHMDHVAVLDRGQVLDQGAPWTLAGRDGPFRRFLERSFV